MLMKPLPLISKDVQQAIILCIFTEASKWPPPENNKADLVVFSFACFGLIVVAMDKTFSVCMCYGHTKIEMKISQERKQQHNTTQSKTDEEEKRQTTKQNGTTLTTDTPHTNLTETVHTISGHRKYQRAIIGLNGSSETKITMSKTIYSN